MVVSETEMISHGEPNAVMQADHHQQPKPISGRVAESHPFSSIGRQSSIYSLTLDEFQHALCESGKNFGSMNMDEFLTSIWNAEENQQASSNIAPANVNNYGNASGQMTITEGGSSRETAAGKGGIAKQVSLPRQGSLTLPAPLCRKTVDEVWSEMHRGQLGNDNNGDHSNNNANMQNTENAPRQPTFGEMTLEDFLVKAGVVREHSTNSPTVLPTKQQHFGVFQSANNPNVSPTFPSRPVPMGDTSSYIDSSKRPSGDGGYPQPHPAAQPAAVATVCYGGGGRGYGPPVQSMGMVGPLSPVSSDGVGSQYGTDMGGLRITKRMMDGPVEKVVERRQRRMIKNRESAARSRARKQAYTVELEAELNQLKEENAQLKRALGEMERKRQQQYHEGMSMNKQKNAQRARERLRTMRRTMSSSL